MPHLLTLVFTDLVDSTAIKLRLPGSDISIRNETYLSSILTPHRGILESQLSQFGGRVVNSEGDAYFLVFKDHVGAVSWAVEVQTRHADHPIPTPLGPLQVKIGMHAGRPLSDPDHEGDYVGHEVDYAARIAGLANGGQIVMSRSLASLVEDSHLDGVVLHDHGTIELKGIGPATVFELLYGGRDAQPLKGAVDRHWKLPPPPAHFTGRADMVALVKQRMQSGGVTILKGEGGIGKTAIALTAVHSAIEEGNFAGGVAWVDCETTPTFDDCLRQAIHVYLGDRKEREDTEQCRDRLQAHLMNGETLLALDNFESMADNADLLRFVSVVRAPASVLITTRRVPPGLRGNVCEVHALPAAEALTLFTSIACAAGIDRTQLSTRDQEAMRDLCDAVGHHPLAIELLAARAARVPLKRLLDRVRRDLSVLQARSDPTIPSRHQSVQACFELSIEPLSENARRLLQRFSVLPAGGDADLIAAIANTDDWDEAAEELVAASLWHLAGNRYQMHLLVRQHVLEDRGEEEATVRSEVVRAVAGACRSRGEEIRAGRSTAERSVAALDWIETEWLNLMACAELAYEAEEWQVVAEFAEAVRDFFWVRGYWHDCERLFRNALTANQRMNQRQGEASALGLLGNLYQEMGRWSEATNRFRECLEIRRELTDREGEAKTLNNLGNVHWSQSNWMEAQRCYEQSLVITREIGTDRVCEMITLHNLGNVYSSLQQWKESESHYRESLAVREQLNDRIGTGQSWLGLGEVYTHQARWAEAEDCFQRSLATLREVGDRIGEAATLDALGNLFNQQSQHERAEETYRQSLAISRECGDAVNAGRTLLNLARLCIRLQKHAEATQRAQQAVALLEQTEDVQLLERARELLDVQ